jgi:hypothetical protein
METFLYVKRSDKKNKGQKSRKVKKFNNPKTKPKKIYARKINAKTFCGHKLRKKMF